MNNKSFKFLLKEWNQAIRESEDDQIVPEKQWFLRFGDPRKLSTNVSMIHNADVVRDQEEYFYSPEGRNLQQYEKGISAYRVIGSPGEKITFIVPIGIRTFRSQLGGFLLQRLIDGDIYIFKAIPTGTYGTDDEPLIIKDSINSVEKVGDADLYATEDVGNPEFRIYDLLDPWDLKSHHDMGADEFFKRKVTQKEIEDYISRLLSKFTNEKQQSVLEGIKVIWIRDLEDEDRV